MLCLAVVIALSFKDNSKPILRYEITKTDAEPLIELPYVVWAYWLKVTNFVTTTPTGFLYVDAEGNVGKKRIQAYSGTTNASGIYSVAFATPYAVAPNIQANIVGGTDLQRNTQTVTTTGFSVKVVQQNTTSVALVGLVLIPGTAPVNGSAVDVIITEK